MSALAIVALSVGYPAIGLIVGRLVGGHFAYGHDYGSHDQPDWFAGFWVGVGAGVLWPAALLVAAACSRVAVGAEREARARIEKKRMQERQDELEREIRRLERAEGIR